MKLFSSVLGGLESEVRFRSSLDSLPIEEITAFEAGPDYSRFKVFADEEFNIGGAWYCVEEQTGAVYRISPEYGEGLEFVNSSVKLFLASLKAAAAWSGKYDDKEIKRDPSCIDALEHALSKIDDAAMSWPKNEWPRKIDHLRQSADPDDDEAVFFFRIDETISPDRPSE